MTFKTVHGLGRAEYAVKAINAAMEKMHTPEYVDRWLTWFDAQPVDFTDSAVCVVDKSECCNRDESGCGNCLEQSRQCRNCTADLVCADDCPQPEFYVGDLEEVAHAVLTRTESAIDEALARFRANSAIHEAKPEWLTALFEGIRAEIAHPGYVEGLIPE